MKNNKNKEFEENIHIFDGTKKKINGYKNWQHR